MKIEIDQAIPLIDLHTRHAMQDFDVEEHEVTHAMRQWAKQMHFIENYSFRGNLQNLRIQGAQSGRINLAQAEGKIIGGIHDDISER